MGAVVTTFPSAAEARTFEFSDSALSLIRRTVAADTNNDEFDLFISYCKALRLDPRRRQIYALVYNKDKPQKRKMSIIIAIDGFRSIAARSGCYRPDEDEPRYESDSALKDPATNPAGLVKAVVRVWQYAHGQWHPSASAAYWDEYAPIKEEWAEGDDGKRRPTGKKCVEGKWLTMPRLMLAKVAEALALRKAWPDDYSGVYSEEEVERSRVAEDMSPSQAAAAGEAQARLKRIGGKNSILVDWMDGKPLAPVPAGQFADKVTAFIEANKEEPSQVGIWGERNKHGLREFWAYSAADALELKKSIEGVLRGASEP